VKRDKSRFKLVTVDTILRLAYLDILPKFAYLGLFIVKLGDKS
jgi:hypothetical protein